MSSTDPTEVIPQDEGLTEKLLSWSEETILRRVLFYLATTTIMTILGLVVTTDGNLLLAKWPKALLAPFAFAVVIDVAIATYAMYRRMLGKYRLILKGLGHAERQLVQHTQSLKVEEKAYFKRVLRSHFSEAISHLMLRQGTEGFFTFTYTGDDDRSVRQQYLRDLRRFIQATRVSYVTLQPGLPWFEENFWFFRTFDDSVSCVRVIMHDTPEDIAETGSNSSLLSAYAYEAGKHTRTLWCLKHNCLRLLNSISSASYKRLTDRIPILLMEAIKAGDLVICDNRVVISYVEFPKRGKTKPSRGQVQFFLVDEDTESALEELVQVFATPSARLVEANSSQVTSHSSVFRLKQLEDAVKHAGSRPYTHKEFTVDLGVIETNAVELRNLLAQHGEIRWVLKANAYGLGARRITPQLFRNGFTKFAFESVTESMEIKHELLDSDVADIENVDILVMEPIQRDQIRSLLELNASCFVWTRQQIDDLARESIALYGTTSTAKVHLKVDLGLRRFGIRPSELPELYEYASSNPNIEVVGIAGHHFAASPDPRVQQTQETFENAVAACFDLAPDKSTFPVVHSRSTGSMPVGGFGGRQWKEEFRLGGALYGVFPTPEARDYFTTSGVGVNQAVRMIARIEAFTPVVPGDTISYGGAKYESTKNGVIGWMNLGYNDGLPASSVGKTLFKYRNVPCEIVGRLGMNFSALDITVPFSNIDRAGQDRLFKGLITSAEAVTVLDGQSPDWSVENFAKQNAIPHYSVLTDFGRGGLNKFVGEISPRP